MNHVEQVKHLFSRIAKRYELTNDLISMGIHRLWTRALIKEAWQNALSQASSHKKVRYVDLCAGTGAIALALVRLAGKEERERNLRDVLKEITLIDFCPQMLEIATEKITRALGSDRFVSSSNALQQEELPTRFLVEDAAKTSLESEQVDLITMAYGLRNIKPRPPFYQELERILAPGGSCLILELTRPSIPLLRWLHRLYLHLVMLPLGWIFTRDRKAYRYLADSIEHFPRAEEIEEELDGGDLVLRNVTPLLFGTATLLCIEKVAKKERESSSL